MFVPLDVGSRSAKCLRICEKAAMLLSTARIFVHHWIVFHCMNKPQLTHCTDDGHLGFFHFRDSMNKATTNILLLNCTHLPFTALPATSESSSPTTNINWLRVFPSLAVLGCDFFFFLHFSDGQWYWAPWHMLIAYVVIFCKCLLKSFFCLSFLGFVLLNCRTVFWISWSSQKYVLQIPPPSLVTCYLTLTVFSWSPSFY